MALNNINMLPDAAAYVDKAWTSHATAKQLIFSIHTELMMNKEVGGRGLHQPSEDLYLGVPNRLAPPSPLDQHEKEGDIASQIPRLRAAHATCPALSKIAKGLGAPGLQAASERLVKDVSPRGNERAGPERELEQIPEPASHHPFSY